MISIRIDMTGAQEKTEKLKKAISPNKVLKIASLAAADAIREHLVELDQSRPNKLGGRRSRFFSNAADSVNVQAPSGDKAVISINQVGIAQRYFGGTIKPVRARFLTIPATAEAYDRRAREFGDLKIERTPRGLGLVRKGAPPGQGTVLFYLARKVTQQPDPSVLPTANELQEAGSKAVDEYLDREIAREAAEQ